MDDLQGLRKDFLRTFSRARSPRNRLDSGSPPWVCRTSRRSRLAFNEPAAPELVDGPTRLESHIKQDRYHTQLILQDRKVCAFSRTATDRFAPVVKATGKIKAKSAILDGEMIGADKNGR